MVRNPPFNAEDVGVISGWETRIAHTAGHLSSHLELLSLDTTRETIQHNNFLITFSISSVDIGLFI